MMASAIESANPDAPAADDANGDDASATATFSFDDDEDAALAAVVDDLAMEPDEHRVPTVAELEKRFGAEFVANLRSPDELIAEAVLRNAGGAPDEALACAAAAVRTHDLCGAADARFRFACHDRRLGVQMMAVFLRVKAPATSARWELLARVKSGLGGGAPFTVSPVTHPRLDVLGGGDRDTKDLEPWTDDDGPLPLDDLLFPGAAPAWVAADLPRLVVVEETLDGGAVGGGLAVELGRCRRGGNGAVIEVLYAATEAGDLAHGDDGPFLPRAEAARQLLVASDARDEWPPRTVKAPAAVVRALARRLEGARASLRTAACVRLRDGFRDRNDRGEDARERCSLRALRDGLRAAYVGRLGGDDDLDPVARAAARKAAGNDAFGAGAHDVALKRWGEAADLLDAHGDPAGLLPSLHANRAEACLRLGRHRDAARFATEALALDPGHAKARLRRCRALKARGKIQDALADAQTVVDAGGDAAARRAATALRDELASLARTNAPTLRVPEDFGTFGAACAAAEASSTGALIVLAPRKYDEAASLRGCADGELRVVVDGDAHAEVGALKVSGARVSLDRLLVTGGAAVAETAGAVTFRRCILSNGNGAALETRGSDVALESSVVEHARDGVLVHGGAFRLSGSTVQYCYCDGVSAHVRVVVEDVVIKDCGGRGLTSTVRFDPFVRRGANDIQADPEFDEADGQRAAAARAAADPAALRQREVDEARHGLRTAADEPESLMAALEGAIAAGIPADDGDMARARRDLQRHAARRDDDDDDAAAGELPGVLPEPQVPRL